MTFKAGVVSFLFKYRWPPAIFAEVCALFGEWQRSNVKNKAILGVFFIPAILSFGGLLLCVAYFVLFKLPSFILSVLGWLLLTALFSGGGLFCYEKLTGKRPLDSSDSSDSSSSSDSSNSSKARRAQSGDYDAETTAEEMGKSWFDNMRRGK
jgi:hypothetical protein